MLVRIMPKKVEPLKRKVAAVVEKKYLLEAQDLHMSLSSYIAWLKEKAGYKSRYDALPAS